MMLVSIVIPAYNAAPFIQETVDSVLSQSIQDFEILILNDGSTDETGRIIDEIARHDQRISIIHKQNSGVSDTRNQGLALAKGKYILFLDADDLLSKDFLKGRIDFLETNPTYSICGSTIQTFSQSSDSHETSYTAPDVNYLEAILLYKKNVASIPSNLIYRRDHLITNGIYFQKELTSTADKYILIETGIKGLKSKHIAGYPLHYRIHSNSMSQKMTLSLLYDNERYFSLLIKNEVIPKHLEKTVLLKNHYILAGMSRQLKLKLRMLKHGLNYYILKILGI